MLQLSRSTTGARRGVLQRLRGDDRGGIATLVAILLAGGVLLGMAALAVDVGQLYAEREELQSGADAAAIAVAKQCAETPVDCVVSVLDGTAERYADDNAKDDASTVSVLCGRLVDSDLPACPPDSDNLTRCINDPPDDEYVEVRTTTELPDGSTLLPPTFARALLGNEGYDGTRVGACARAAYGPPKPASGLAVTISICEWEKLTGGGTDYPPAPPYPPNPMPPAGTDKPIYLHNTEGASSCPAGPSGWDEPGGFGWLDEDGGPCQAVIDEQGEVGGNTGAPASSTCQEVLDRYYYNHEVLFIPVHDGTQGTGANTTYHIAGMAAFVLTGYALPGFRKPSWVSGGHFCKGPEHCIYGFFTQDLMPVTGPTGGPDLGARIVSLVG